MESIQTSIDCVIFGFQENQLKVLLIQRRNEPQKSMMALPGDFIRGNESIDQSAYRTLNDITNLNDIFLEQVRAFGETDRYPTGRVITIGYYALINADHYDTKAGYTAERLSWCPIENLPVLAFDHQKIITAAYEILKERVRYKPIGFNLLPDSFSLTQLQILYEAILQTQFNKRNFRNKIEQMKLLIDTGKKQENVAHKPAKLYRFDQTVYQRLVTEGLYFKL